MVKIGALILAAGKSTRMGKPKLLLRFKGAPLITHPVSLAIQSQLQPIVCMTGGYEEEIAKVLGHFQKHITIKHNPHYESGMASSLKEGIHAFKGKVDAVLIFLGDQPLLLTMTCKEFLFGNQRSHNSLLVLNNASFTEPFDDCKGSGLLPIQLFFSKLG